MKNDIIEQIKQEKLIAILRLSDVDSCVKAAKALFAGGIRLLEIPFPQTGDRIGNTPAAIRAVSQELGGRVTVGAGTVIRSEQLKSACQAGAGYIISPVWEESLIRETERLGLVSIPGAMTPTEILRARLAGADIIKLFPAASLGCAYLKAILTPLSGIPILAVGGINRGNIMDFIRSGAVGAGIGGSLVNKQDLTQEAASLVSLIRKGI